MRDELIKKQRDGLLDAERTKKQAIIDNERQQIMYRENAIKALEHEKLENKQAKVEKKTTANSYKQDLWWQDQEKKNKEKALHA
jgi:hypothetical protein